MGSGTPVSGQVIPDGTGGLWIPFGLPGKSYTMLHCTSGHLQPAPLPVPSGTVLQVAAAAAIPGQPRAIAAGLVFPATAVTAMSDIADDRAGLASGLMTTAHEIGAALGVAVFSAVAVAIGGGIAAGYRHGFMVAAAVAAGLAVAAALAVPAVRPPAGARVAVH